mmetsp:Transcript_33906/g.76675  ORF Transcript_33906/g.76675 Transcript_33906/m.76675 type:complete len:567 (+) Transcript_33906:226-1926(+)
MPLHNRAAGRSTSPNSRMGDKHVGSGPKATFNTWMGWGAMGTVITVLIFLYGGMAQPTGPPEDLSAITWNMAAINNNPFEYWITHDDPKYNKLMEDVSQFINDPGDKDVPVHEVFTQAMFDELCERMKQAGWDGVDEVQRRWATEYKDRRIISGFIKDGTIGKKRLASMPDRYTNTINLADGGVAMRPTVINCFSGVDLGTSKAWWKAWVQFMFEKQVTVESKGSVETKPIRNMLSKIKNAKYPAISLEEEAISIPLQAMAGAIFDAILVHMMNALAPTTWQPLREDMCDKLNRKKNDRTIDILETTYQNVDIQFLQEVAGAFIKKASARKLGSTLFEVHFPAELDSDRDQNSLILLKRGVWKQVKEVTSEVASVGQSKGDLFVLEAERARDGQKFLLASFHGDTNGLLTLPVVTAVHDFARRPGNAGVRKLLFGMDANTYEVAEPGKNQGVELFAEFYTSRGLNSCYGPTPNPKNYTTFHARTYLQPQLNKAIRFSEKDVKGDKNPKDFIVFDQLDFAVRWTTKDNTGSGSYVEGMVFPTLAFPSDHGITATSLAKGPTNTGLRH